jgi:hypothetical protein
MATIGSIKIAFDADISALRAGIKESIDLVDGLSKRMGSLSSSDVKLAIAVDTTALDAAVAKIEAASGATITLKTAVESEELDEAAGEVDEFASQVEARSPAVAVSVNTEQARQEFSRTSAAAERFSSIVSSNASGAMGEYREAAEAAGSAASGLADAFGVTGQGSQSAEQSISRVVVAVGRSQAAWQALSAAAASAGALFRGFSNVSAAAAGSLVATSVAAASLGSAIVGATASTLTFAGIMGATRAATAGLSEEARGFVEGWARIPATAAAAYAGLRATAAVFPLIANAVYDSGSAAAFFQSVLSSLSGAAQGFSSQAVRLTTSLGVLLTSFRLVTSAANERISLSQYGMLVAQLVATSAATGAAGGAIASLAAGTSVAAGAMGGAVASVTALASAIPLVTPVAIAAAVATGRFSHELEQMSLAAQATEQMADRFGSSTQEMSKLRLAAQNTNVSMGQLAKGQQAFYTSLSKIKLGQFNVESVREAKLAYDKLKISVEDLKSKKPDEAFRMVAAAISEVEDPAERTAIAFDLFGRQGAAILPALKELGELEEDFNRLGGALSDLNFDRFTTLETSFDRLHAAAGNLGQALMLPFVEMQKAFNNATADIQGGLSAALTPVMGVLADMTKPLAVVIELVGRVIGIFLRLAGVVLTVVAGFLDFALIADLIEAVGEAFKYILSFVESAISVLEEIAQVISSFLRPAITGLSEGIVGFGKAMIGAIGGAIASLTIFNLAMQSTAVRAVASAAITYAAIGVGVFGGILALIPAAVAGLAFYAASWIASAASAMASAIIIGAAWLIALGPVGIAIAGVIAVGAAFAGLYMIGGELYNLFAGIGEALGFVGSQSVKIDAATASVEELAAAAEQNSKSSLQKDSEAVATAVAPAAETVQVDFGDAAGTAQAEFGGVRDAVVEFGASFGITEEQASKAFEAVASTVRGVRGVIAQVAGDIAKSLQGPSREEIMESVSAARDKMGELVIESAKLGQAGADAASASTVEFNKLQQSLANGSITLEEFDSEAARLEGNLRKNLETLKNDSPEITLKKNLELYKQLDDSVKAVGKSVRDIGAGMQIEDKFFPTSDAIKERAAEYKAEYEAAIEAIKKKQQSGGFASELNQKKATNEEDFASGKISSEQYSRVKMELDSTNAQEQASIAAEDVKRTLDRKMKVGVELDQSFAENIRKKLEDAFLTPVGKYQKELKKIEDNKSLTDVEKASAKAVIAREAREGLVGKSAQATLSERTRDLNEGASSGLVGGDELQAQLAKAADDFASAVGVTKTPFEAFSSSLNNITTQFGFAGKSLEQVRTALSGNPEQLKLFERALKEARDNMLASLGIEKSPEQVFQEQMKKIEEAATSADPEKRITQGQADQARRAASRKRDADLGAGAGLGESFAEKQAKINEAFGGGKDRAREEIANNALAMEKRRAAGLDADPAQELQAGSDKINDVFNVTGKTIAEIRATLSPKDFADYQAAQKKNAENVKASLGVEKTAASKFAESRDKLNKAVRDGVITEVEKNKALKAQRDSMLSSLGITKSPAQDFEDAVSKIKENAAELSPEELAKGMKAAKDKLLSSLGIDQGPAVMFSDRMKDLNEALLKGQISQTEFAKGAQKAKDSLLQSLGIPLEPAVQLKQRMADLEEAFFAGQISTEEFSRGQDEARRSMLPGADAESPVKKFERDLKSIEQAATDGSISTDELAQRRLNLQAQLQEDLKPALDSTKADRRGIESSDVRSKAGVDTFFRILRGNDNPSLKAQLEIARNTRVLAEASKNPDAAPVLAQLSVR